MAERAVGIPVIDPSAVNELLGEDYGEHPQSLPEYLASWPKISKDDLYILMQLWSVYYHQEAQQQGVETRTSVFGAPHHGGTMDDEYEKRLSLLERDVEHERDARRDLRESIREHLTLTSSMLETEREARASWRETIDAKFDGLNTLVGGLNTRIDDTNTRITDVKTQANHNKNVTIGVITAIIALAGVVVALLA